MTKKKELKSVVRSLILGSLEKRLLTTGLQSRTERSRTSRSQVRLREENVIVLPDIRSSLNVGSIFRTADACGIGRIYLTGYTPAPIDKFGRADKQIAKTALGAEKTIAWEKVEDVSKLITKLKKEGFYLIAIEQDGNSVDYKKVKIKEKTAFIFGNEVEGLAKNILKKCDVVAEIPMRGDKESLNVSVSAGVALFRILDI